MKDPVACAWTVFDGALVSVVGAVDEWWAPLRGINADVVACVRVLEKDGRSELTLRSLV